MNKTSPRLIAHRGSSADRPENTISSFDLALEQGVSIAPHGCQELQLPLAASIAHGEFLEYYPVAVDPLRAEMFMPRMEPDRDGFVTVPDRPGVGYELNMELLNRYKVG